MLETFARMELARLVTPEDDGTQIAINRSIMELVSAFAAQGHSGSTAPYTAMLFARLVAYKPLTPLTGDDDEWTIVGEHDGKPLRQNKRRSSIFREGDDQAYDSEGRVFVEPDGATFTSQPASRVPVTFPYTVPETPEYVDRPWDWPEPVRIDNLAANERGWLFMEGNITSDEKPFTGGLYPGQRFVRGQPATWSKDFETFHEGRDYFDRAVRAHGKPTDA